MTTAEIVKNPNFIITLVVFVVAVAVIGLMVWQEKRPRKSLSPGLIPHVPVMLFSGIIALLALVHLVNLLGIHTGR